MPRRHPRNATRSVYFSVDVGSDGPIPGPYSMLSLGASVAAHHDETGFHPLDPRDAVFYRELRPISDSYLPDSVRATGLDRDHLLAHGADPAAAMADFTAWVTRHSPGARAVMVGFPGGHDWMFTYWYLINFLGTSPFGYSRMLDLKSLYTGVTGRSLATVSLPATTSRAPGAAPRADNEAVAKSRLLHDAQFLGTALRARTARQRPFRP